MRADEQPRRGGGGHPQWRIRLARGPKKGVRLGLCLRPRDDLVDHVVAESALREEGVDLAFPLGWFERFPAAELTRDGPARAVALAFGGHLPERRVDRFAGHPLARELAHEGAVALRAEA